MDDSSPLERNSTQSPIKVSLNERDPYEVSLTPNAELSNTKERLVRYRGGKDSEPKIDYSQFNGS